MAKSLKNKPVSLPSDTGISLGFFCGSIVAALGVYMATTPNGRQLRQRIKQEFENHHQKLLVERLVVGDPEDNSGDVEPAKILNAIRDLIARAKEKLNPNLAKPKAKHLQPSPGIKKKKYFKQK